MSLSRALQIFQFLVPQGPVGPVSKVLVLIGDPQERVFRSRIFRLSCNHARFFRAATPVLRVTNGGFATHARPLSVTEPRHSGAGKPICNVTE